MGSLRIIGFILVGIALFLLFFIYQGSSIPTAFLLGMAGWFLGLWMLYAAIFAWFYKGSLDMLHALGWAAVFICGGYFWLRGRKSKKKEGGHHV